MWSNGKVSLPKDAEGKEIPLDVEFLYSANGESVKPYSFTFRRYDGFCWEMNLVGAPTNLVYDPKSFYFTPPDSWEKLLDDLDNAAKGGDNAECLYSRREGVAHGSQCYGCKLYNSDYGSSECEYLAYADIAARIRKLAAKDGE